MESLGLGNMTCEQSGVSFFSARRWLFIRLLLLGCEWLFFFMVGPG